jgi:hypothetical protein
MGLKAKPGMHCDRCGPVAAQKQTHKARASLLFAATWGASMGAGGGEWHCPNCGGLVVSMAEAERKARKEAASEGPAGPPEGHKMRWDGSWEPPRS